MEKKPNETIVRPSPKQIEWAEAEVGVIIHFDMQVFEPTYKFRKQWGYQPDPSVFYPKELDTDQWIRIAKKAGANYAILVVKHCSGFTLWPSKNYKYSIAQTPWRNGKGDILSDFISSCKKFRLKPGFYYSTGCNAFMEFDQHIKGMPDQNTEKFQEYYDLVKQQLTEIWTNYGEIFEVWFDGGHFPGSPNTKAMLEKYQPNVVAFQGPKGYCHNLRWVGNELGNAPRNCWSTIQNTDHYDGTKNIGDKNKGDPDGKIWQPAETDTPNREFQWFWKPAQEHLVIPAEILVRYYYNSVGKNTNLLLGMVIDDRGLVPEKDKREFLKFGKMIQKRFSNPIKTTQGRGHKIQMKFNEPVKINQVVLKEDISKGHVVREYFIEGSSNFNERNGGWKKICGAKAIGHKRIHIFSPVKVSALQIRIEESIKGLVPHITECSVYNVPKLAEILPKWLRYLKFGWNLLKYAVKSLFA